MLFHTIDVIHIQIQFPIHCLELLSKKEKTIFYQKAYKCLYTYINEMTSTKTFTLEPSLNKHLHRSQVLNTYRRRNCEVK